MISYIRKLERNYPNTYAALNSAYYPMIIAVVFCFIFIIVKPVSLFIILASTALVSFIIFIIAFTAIIYRKERKYKIEDNLRLCGMRETVLFK